LAADPLSIGESKSIVFRAAGKIFDTGERESAVDIAGIIRGDVQTFPTPAPRSGPINVSDVPLVPITPSKLAKLPTAVAVLVVRLTVIGPVYNEYLSRLVPTPPSMAPEISLVPENENVSLPVPPVKSSMFVKAMPLTVTVLMPPGFAIFQIVVAFGRPEKCRRSGADNILHARKSSRVYAGKQIILQIECDGGRVSGEVDFVAAGAAVDLTGDK